MGHFQPRPSHQRAHDNPNKTSVNDDTTHNAVFDVWHQTRVVAGNRQNALAAVALCRRGIANIAHQNDIADSSSGSSAPLGRDVEQTAAYDYRVANYPTAAISFLRTTSATDLFFLQNGNWRRCDRRPDLDGNLSIAASPATAESARSCHGTADKLRHSADVFDARNEFAQPDKRTRPGCGLATRRHGKIRSVRRLSQCDQSRFSAQHPHDNSHKLFPSENSVVIRDYLSPLSRGTLRTAAVDAFYDQTESWPRIADTTTLPPTQIERKKSRY